MRRREAISVLNVLAYMFAMDVFSSDPLRAELRLAKIFSDHMVLQRDKPIRLWGWGNPGEEVRVKLSKQTKETRVNELGRWKIKLQAMPVGGPHQLKVSGKNHIVLKDIWMGEVWLCSGQSNMGYSVSMIKNGKKEIESAHHPQIRLFQVPLRMSSLPAEEMVLERNVRNNKYPDQLLGKWNICSPETVWGFSGAGYFFGRELNQKLKIPIGLISVNQGGAAIEMWMNMEGYASQDGLKEDHEMVLKARNDYRKALKEIHPQMEAWVKDYRMRKTRNLPIHPAPMIPFTYAKRSATALYNGMVSPIVGLGIRGCIWYQGEANVEDGLKYVPKMKALISGWRKVWRCGDFPFYYVQLAPYARYRKGKLPLMWEAQSQCLEIPNTGMIVTTDIGELRNIHPANKQDVGKRLAKIALARDYDHKVVYSGPKFELIKTVGNKVRVKFSHVGAGLKARDGEKLSDFEIASEKGEYVKAEAKIDGDEVIVWSEQVPHPIKVRFAWKNTAEPNFINAEGLPAIPFRTHREESGF